MDSSPQKPSTSSMDNMLVIGCGLTAVYWLMASLLDAMQYGGSLTQWVLGYNASELMNRLLVICFFMIFGSHAQWTITQRRKVEKALQDSEEKYGTIIDDIEDGYYEIDPDGRLLFSNDSVSMITGFGRDELKRMNIRGLMGQESRAALSGILQTVRRNGQPIKDREITLICKDGTQRFAEMSVSLIGETKDSADGFRGIIRDVTRRKQAEALKQEKLAAEAASRSKSEFLANMSHEIRTPLNAIIGLTELMLEEDFKPEHKESLQVVRSAAYALLSVINDILDFSKIEAGKLELEQYEFSLSEFIEDTMKIMAVKAQEKGLEIVYHLPADVPDTLVGDAIRLRQVFLNLIGNAIKFTQDGEVMVAVAVEKYTHHEVLLRMTVSDTGVGIPADKQSKIFQAFEQADGSTSRKYGGTGLGLAISSQLVELMGGQLRVKSAPGQGSRFSFTARFGLVETRRVPAHPPEILAGIRVLVVDDNPAVREVLGKLLEEQRIFSVQTGSASEALSLVTQKQAMGVPFDIAWVDAEMPDSDTPELIRGLSAHMRVVAMLAATGVRDKAGLQKAGAVAFVTKPVGAKDVVSAMETALGVSPSTGVSQGLKIASEQAGNLQALGILVAEDTPFNQKFIQRLLENWGCRPVIVNSGRLAVEAVRQHRFDIILMDIQMPEMDGLEATSAIRALEKSRGDHTPIIAMTAHAMKGDRERCLDAGMDDYLSKPISARKLQDIVQRLCPEAADGTSPSDASSPPKAPAPALDKEKLMSAFNGDAQFFQDVINMFIHDYSPMLDTIKSALAGKDLETVRRTAHSLKGMALNFQSDTAGKEALALEHLDAEPDWADAHAIFDKLVREMDQLADCLRNMLEDKI